MTTSAIDVIIATFSQLAREEQDDCWERLRLLRLDQLAVDDTDLQRFARAPRSLDEMTDDILDQARTLYRMWPDTFAAELPL